MPELRMPDITTVVDNLGSIGNKELSIITNFNAKNRIINSYFLFPDTLVPGGQRVKIPVNKAIPKKDINLFHPQAIELGKKLVAAKDTGDQNSLPDIISEILVYSQNIKEIFALTDEQRNHFINSLLDIVINNINFTTKVWFIKIPSRVVRTLVAPLVKATIISIVDKIQHLLTKKK